MDPSASPRAAAAAAAVTPRWNHERPFLTGLFHQELKPSSRIAGAKPASTDSFRVPSQYLRILRILLRLLLCRGSEILIGSYPVAVQELLIIDDLLSTLVGIEGRFILIKRARGKEDRMVFQIDSSTDLALQELAQRIFPLCENYILVEQFAESRSHFKNGLVNHAFAAAIRALLLDYQAMVAQLEHQFRLGRLSVQGLWFFCQPMLASMHALSNVIAKVSSGNLSGSATINLLQNQPITIMTCSKMQAKAMAGDNAVRTLLEKMTQCASAPYLKMLGRWVYEGVIDDPYGEFFISENKSLLKESLTHDYDAKYWKQRYSLKDGIPSFLTDVAGMILTTGKYLNVMRECEHNVQVPVSDNAKLMSFESNHHYLECIKTAYQFASSELLDLIKEKYDLVGKLRSMKHYFLLDQGDFLVHFMDIARDELAKKPNEISVEKLQSLLDLALRTTAASADPCHEELTCCVERASLLKKLTTLKVLVSSHDSTVNQHDPGSSDQLEPISLTGLETFSLSYKVLEPNWHLMHGRLQTAKSIDEVIQFHDFFLDKCLKECLLLMPQLLKKIEKLKSICLQYSTATQLLIPSIYISNPESTVGPSIRAEKSKSKRKEDGRRLQLATDNSMLLDSIMTFEKEFSVELQSLSPILCNSSQAEPYLTHLAQCILGVGDL
ncbi:hypothetical protein Taro_045043 [Colocasia esculenta]|uniref:Gamma-tubulin complex component n=1 Tax=Colocasia esculenta TaxID=4460 RepID=A0A843WQ80_COLES|nr:hypothetical protein [Colocasia esculenta]